jgi:hypothetical protein
METKMQCLHCRNLERAFEIRRNEYIQASSLASRSVSSKFAAYINVEMERALNELQDHRSICHGSTAEMQSFQDVAQFRKLPEVLRGRNLESVA